MSDENRTPEESEVEGHPLRHGQEEPKTEQETEQMKDEDRAPDPEGGGQEVEGHGFRH